MVLAALNFIKPPKIHQMKPQDITFHETDSPPLILIIVHILEISLIQQFWYLLEHDLDQS